MANSTTTTRDRPEYRYCELPRCECGCARLLAYRSRRETDGSITRWCKCADCGRRVVVVWE